LRLRVCRVISRATEDRGRARAATTMASLRHQHADRPRGALSIPPGMYSAPLRADRRGVYRSSSSILRVAMHPRESRLASGARNTASFFSIDQTVRHIEAAREAGCILSPRALRCRRMRAIRGPWADLRAVEARRAIRRRDERPLFARRIFHRRVGLSAAPNISDRRRRTNSRAPGPVLSKSVARRRPCSEWTAAHFP